LLFGWSQPLQAIALHELVVDLAVSIFILEVLLRQFVISLPCDKELRFYIIEGGLFEGGVVVLGDLLAFWDLTDIIEIHNNKIIRTGSSSFLAVEVDGGCRGQIYWTA
jgi:hypothetical protein